MGTLVVLIKFDVKYMKASDFGSLNNKTTTSQSLKEILRDTTTENAGTMN